VVAPKGAPPHTGAVSGSASTRRREALERFQQKHHLGQVTVVFTDIVASTDLKQTLGDLAAQALINAHHERVRQILGEFADAQEIETAGDSFLLVFANPADAVTFALRLQTSLRAQSRGQAAVRDRIGIHVGKVLVGEGGVFGVDVDTCARVMSTGDPDQILLTRPAHDEAKKILQGRAIRGVERIVWRAHGRYHFKGLGEPLELFEVGEEGKARLHAPEDSEKAVRYRPGRVPIWPGPSGRRVSRRLWIRAAYATAVTLALVLGAGLFFPERMSSLIDKIALREPQCIVVLPFRGLESNPDWQALADGVSRTVVSRLTQLEASRWSLRVVPISEVFAEKVESLADARRLFGATLVLSGDATASGDTLRVNVMLSDARARRQLKSTTLDLGPQSLLGVQDKVAKLAADWLGLTMSAAEGAEASVKSVTAFAAYLRGLGSLARQDRKEQRDRAVAAFEESLRQEPGYAPAHAGLCEAYLRVYERDRRDDPGLLARAKASCDEAIRLDAKLPASRVALAAVQFRYGRYEESITGYQLAMQLEPGNSEALRGLAGAFSAAGKTGDAEATYKSAIARSPEYWGGHSDLGVFYNAIGRYADAEASFRRTVAIVPDSYAAYRNLGGVLYSLGRLDDAVAMSQKSLELKPSAETFSNVGTIEFTRGNYAAAARNFERAVELNPTLHLLWGNLADAYEMIPDRRQRAIESYRQAITLADREIALNPRDSHLRASAATYLLGMQEYPRALQEAEKALELTPDSVNLIFLAALVNEAAGHRADALQLLEQAARKGYAPIEIQRHPQLAKLRADPGFRRIQHLLDSTGQPSTKAGRQ
jgi:class 3 adenylate cyclase/tetratricopeptide (TPR) repeat protein/TolB-like protein